MLWPLRAANRSSDEKPQMTAVCPDYPLAGSAETVAIGGKLPFAALRANDRIADKAVVQLLKTNVRSKVRDPIGATENLL
jgi:hypothetical protein